MPHHVRDGDAYVVASKGGATQHPGWFHNLTNRLERLSGERAGQYSIRINDQWRVCFEWEQGDAFDVEITDYH